MNMKLMRIAYNKLRQAGFLLLTVLMATTASEVFAQERTVQNRPYADLRTFHFGVLVGAHLQDLELVNAGHQTYVNDEGQEVPSLVTVDQDRWDPGFTVGVLGELRLSTHFQFRVAPAMYFGTRHLTYHNQLLQDTQGNPIEQRQEMKTAYFSTAFDLIFAAPRFNNHRPYVIAGVTPMLNLSNTNDDYLKLKKTDVFLEVGVGCDFYLPFFKLRPELKFMYGITNSIDKNHPNEVKDKNMLPYALASNKARSKMIALTFYFE